MSENNMPDELKDRVQGVLAQWASEQGEEDMGMIGTWLVVFDVHELQGGNARYYARGDHQTLDGTWAMAKWINKLYDTMMDMGMRQFINAKQEDDD